MDTFVPEDGFATCQDESAYPELWDGCIGAFCPSLGITGTRVKDWTGMRADGTIVFDNISQGWNIIGGSYCLSTNNASDVASYGNGTSPPAAFSFWAYFPAIVANKSILTFGSVEYNMLMMSASAGNPVILFGTTNAITTSLLLGNESLSFHHYVINVTSASNVDVWFDGRKVLSAANTGTDVTGALRFGVYPNGISKIAMSVDDIRIYNRTLKDGEITSLYCGGYGCGNGRGVAYTPRTRRYFSPSPALFNPAWARQRSGIVGGGVI